MTQNQSLSANAVVLAGSGDGMKILVVKRRFPPFAGKWALPGGFVKETETPIGACLRELEKETGIEAKESDAIKLTLRSNEQRDPRGAIEAQAFLFFFPSHEGLGKAVQNESIRECGWMPLTGLTDLAFDHGAILCEALGKFWDFMPNYDKKTTALKLPNVYSPKAISSKKKIVFFGGSFNPWHEGHQACLDLCPNKNLVVIPDFNPLKERDENSDCRWKTYKELADSLADSDCAVFPGFWGKEQPNPTVDWLPHTEASERELLIGRDSYANILKWKKVEDIISNINTLFVVPRDIDEDLDEEHQNKVTALNKDLVIQVLAEHKFQHVSSTELRGKPESH